MKEHKDRKDMTTTQIFFIDDIKNPLFALQIHLLKRTF